MYIKVEDFLEAVCTDYRVEKARIEYEATWSKERLTGVVSTIEADLVVAFLVDRERSQWMVGDLVMEISTYGDRAHIRDASLNESGPFWLIDHVRRCLNGEIRAPSSVVAPPDGFAGDPIDDEAGAHPEPPEDARPFVAETDEIPF